ncbi:MAG TPA: cytochrome c peroxidase [Acetobacteraceae bacterium]|nr:cytochrome c peroxidase [Acetobacteraceae bacterium]
MWVIAGLAAGMARIRDAAASFVAAIGRDAASLVLLLCLPLCLAPCGATAQAPFTPLPPPATAAGVQPITPIPQPPAADPRKLALGESLFCDRRLSHDGSLSCSSCHDLHTNGADDDRRTMARNGAKMPFTVLSVFNAALSFRLNWEGNFRTLQAQTESSLENPANMATGVDEVLAKLRADPLTVQRFREAYGHGPDRTSLLDAVATYERSLLTPDSRFDQFLKGDTAALTPEEHDGYQLFQTLGCISCHQGVNIGGNLYERHGIFHPLAAPKPEILRVPSLRNVATLAPYFQDGSAPTLDDAVRKMASAQLDQSLSADQVAAIVAFLHTLTGKYHGVPVRAPP